MKRTRFILVLLYFTLLSSNFINSHSLFDTNSYKKTAHDYIENYSLQSADPNDLCFILNALYFSYARSAQTLTTQLSSQAHLNYSWQAWQETYSCRLNPGNVSSLNINTEKAIQASHDFWQNYSQQKHINNCYNTMVKNIIHGDYIKHSLSKDYLHALRQKARVIMLDSLADVKEHLNDLIEASQKKSLTKKLSHLADFMNSYIPQLAVNTFIKADKMHTKLMTDSWDFLHNISNIGIMTWEPIEKTRSAFYQAQYSALYTLMKKRSLRRKYFKFCIEEHIILEKPIDSLPIPESLLYKSTPLFSY